MLTRVRKLLSVLSLGLAVLILSVGIDTIYIAEDPYEPIFSDTFLLSIVLIASLVPALACYVLWPK